MGRLPDGTGFNWIRWMTHITPKDRSASIEVLITFRNSATEGRAPHDAVPAAEA